MYKTNPRTLEELKRNIRDEINISRGELQRVMENFIMMCRKYMDNEGNIKAWSRIYVLLARTLSIADMSVTNLRR